MNPTSSPSLTEATVRDALTRVYDPEFGVSIEDLGLIYEVGITAGRVAVAMTLTSINCPAGHVIMEGVRAAIAALPGVDEVDVVLVWEPAWTPEFLSAKARQQLGWNRQEG
jgi:metal-sulfur cluster biosynthetic enzyme